MTNETKSKIDTALYIADQIVTHVVQYSLYGLIIYAIAKAVGVIG